MGLLYLEEKDAGCGRKSQLAKHWHNTGTTLAQQLHTHSFTPGVPVRPPTRSSWSI